MRYIKTFFGFTVLFAILFANVTVPTFYGAQQVKYEYYYSSIHSRSYEATMRVFSQDENGVGTGTYFDYRGKGIVLTASHVVGRNRTAKIEYMGSLIEVPIIYNDQLRDIAILHIGDLPTLKPIKFKTAKLESLTLGEEFTYVGFPNNHGPFALFGTFAGVADEFYIMQSYAWPGSSGASVFDKQGKIVGIITAVEVGSTPFGYPQLIPEIVLITPIELINFEILDFILKEMI